MSIDLSGYIDVAERVREFRAKHPEGSLQPLNLDEPFTIRDVGNKTFIVYVAAAYRTPDDARPGVGIAWEEFPGKTPYTKDSELMNAETSAWGRSIVAALAADTQKIASAEEVRNRAGAGPDGTGPTAAPRQARPQATSGAGPARTASDKQRRAIERLVDKTGMIPGDGLWPLPENLTMAQASEIIDRLQAEPVDPPAERVATMRTDDGPEKEFVDGVAS